MKLITPNNARENQSAIRFTEREDMSRIPEIKTLKSRELDAHLDLLASIKQIFYPGRKILWQFGYSENRSSWQEVEVVRTSGEDVTIRISPKQTRTFSGCSSRFQLYGDES